MVLYPSIPHEASLNPFREALDNRENKHIPIDDLLKMAEFVLKNNYFKLNGKVKKHLLRTAIGIKFAQTCVSLWINLRVIF